MTGPLRSVDTTSSERAEVRPGDDLVAPADVVMDRAFTVPGSPDTVFPWIRQLGKQRAGWYLPRSVERLVPPRRRALRHLDPRWQDLQVGDVIPDWGGADATFTVSVLEPPHVLVHTSQRGRTHLSWSIALRPTGPDTRVLLRLRLAPVRRRRLAHVVGGGFDWLTIVGLAAGLRERLTESAA